MNYVLSLNAIFEGHEIYRDKKGQLVYLQSNIFDDFEVEIIYQFVINETPLDILKEVKHFVFINDINSEADFGATFTRAIRMNPKGGLDEDSMRFLFSRYSILTGEVLDIPGILTTAEKERILFHSKALTHSLAKLLNMSGNNLSGVLDSRNIIKEPRKYISYYLNIKNIYKDYQGKDSKLTINLGEKNLIDLLNKNLLRTFNSIGLSDTDTNKIYIVEEEAITFNRLYPKLHTFIDGDIEIHDCTQIELDFKLKKKAYWLKEFHRLTYDEQINYLKKIQSKAFDKKLIIINSKTLSDNLLVNSIFKEFVFIIPNFNEMSTNLSLLFLCFLNERRTLNIDHYTQSLIINDKFRKYLENFNSYLELEHVAKKITLNSDFNFRDVNKWYEIQIILDDLRQIKVEHSLDQDQIEEADIKLEFKYQFIKRKNGAFKIIFNGELILLPKLDYFGLTYIQGIFRDGDEPDGSGIDASELIKLRTRNTEQSSEEIDEMVNSELSIDGRPGELHDETAIKVMMTRREEINEILNSNITNIDETEDLEEEQMKLEEYLSKATNIFGKARKREKILKRDFKAVQKNIDLVMGEIEKVNQDFFNYLNAAIKRSQVVDYSYIFIPSPEIEWILDEQ